MNALAGLGDLIWMFPLALLVVLALISITNALSFPRLRRAAPPNDEAPMISVLIPARDEAANISETVQSWQQQDYPNYEVLILDDHSTDDTAELAWQAIGGDERFRVIRGAPLPEGWLGKNWACQQLAGQAKGQLLLFSDADVRWTSGAVGAVAAVMGRYRADLLTVWPTQTSRTWTERLVVPMMSFVLLSYLPEIFVRYLPWRVFAAANGQCLAFSRHAYAKIGGHAAVRENVLEDVALARAAKRIGLRLVMAEGNRQVITRMYTGWIQVRDGFAKNILAGHGSSPFLLLLSAIFHWTLFLIPWLWLAFGWLDDMPAWPAAPLALIGLGLGLRLLSAAVSKQRLRDAVLLPLSVLLVTRIAAHSLYWYYRYGGPQWKGRRISNRLGTQEGANNA